MYAYFSKGDLPLSVFMTVCSTMVAFVAMPGLMYVYSKALRGNDGDGAAGDAFDLGELIKGLFLVLIPVFGGVCLRSYGPPTIADRMVSIGGALGFAFIFIIMVYYLVDPDNRRTLMNTEAEVFIATIALGVVGATLGYTTGRFVAREEPRQCRTIAFETGIQNGPLSIGIANAAFLLQKTYDYDYGKGEGNCAQRCEVRMMDESHRWWWSQTSNKDSNTFLFFRHPGGHAVRLLRIRL